MFAHGKAGLFHFHSEAINSLSTDYVTKGNLLVNQVEIFKTVNIF